MRADSRPLSRRAISEVQLMHSVGLRKHIQQRQDWLQEHMQDIHTAPRNYGKMSSERIVLEHLLSKDFASDTENGDLVDSLDTQ
ncbi:parathyroid hormone [Clarias magur]|uniref:Parathyroid hormone n=1 Tax=Clarias magur TaxID=1594786 RepID=A0A8J4XDD3_CLAMG|nr:parathyroid hormone [Clarias magur]